VVLIGEIKNKYLISLWQSSLNIDLDIYPSDELPKIKLSDQIFIQGEPADQSFQDSGYPSKSFLPLFLAKLLEMIQSLVLFIIIYAIIDIAYTFVSNKTFQKYALKFKSGLYEMIFLSFVIRYALENFLAITMTISLEISDLYFDRHSRFRNKRTDLLFSLSILITIFIFVLWTISLILLYIRLFKITNRSPMYGLIVDLKLDKTSLIMFYSCFFSVRIIVTILVFVS